jgi:hypothetical protein
MLYDVTVDGAVSSGSPSGDVLVSVSALNQGYHTVGLTAKQAAQDSSGTFLLESATVTVGTGLTKYEGSLLLFFYHVDCRTAPM